MLEIKVLTRRPRATPTMDARAIQRALNRAVAAGLTVDGVLGPLTRNAIRTFQRTRGLTTDGIVGAPTVRARRRRDPGGAHGEGDTEGEALFGRCDREGASGRPGARVRRDQVHGFG